MEEYVDHTLSRLEGARRINDLEASYLIYRLVKAHAPAILKRRETFAEFLPWARQIILFIDQLDLEDIDAAAMKDIQLNARIGYDVPADINMLLEHILLLRQQYHLLLKDKGLMSRGLAYLSASRIEDGGSGGFDMVFFCNLFYLHRTEERLIRNAYECGKAVVIFKEEGSGRFLTRLPNGPAGILNPLRQASHPINFPYRKGLIFIRRFAWFAIS